MIEEPVVLAAAAHEAAREAVLDAAAELLSRPDGAATSIEEIAQASGVSNHTIYRWWPSKGTVLLDALVEQAKQEAGVIYPACQGCRACACGVSVEALQYVEDSHVLRVFFFHVVQSLQDNRMTREDGSGSR